MATVEHGAKMLTSVPGPRGQELGERRARYVPRAIGTSIPTFAARGEGALLEDVDGNRYIDFAGGIGVLNVGHANAEVVAAVQEQAERYLHTCFHVMMPPAYVELAQRLTEITPGAFPKKTMLTNSGAEAVENAVKIARYATGRPGIIAYEYGFHGRTLLTMTLTGKVSPYKYGFGPLAPEVYHVPSPYCYRCPCGLERAGCELECLGLLRQTLRARVAADKVAGVLIEPVQGEGGFIVIPPEYMVALRGLCREEGILLIIDEVQTGFARTGKLFACEHSGVEPDIMVMAKSLAAGLPLSAVVGRTEIMDAPHVGGLGGTYGGNPLACVAALKVIEIMQRDDLPARARKLGELAFARFHQMQERYPLIGDVRGLGAMVAIELVKDRQTKEPATKETSAVIAAAYQRGLVLIKAGMFDNVIRILVPLVATEGQVAEGLDILEAAIQTVSS